MTETTTKKIIIKGVTQDGRKFRPSDWAQRLTNAIASYGPGRRVRNHPKVYLATMEGVDCVVLDASLENDEPMLYGFLINFARSNHLQMMERE